MLEDATCRALCPLTFTDEDVKKFKWHISREYQYTFFLDNLPSAQQMQQEDGKSAVRYEKGVPVGFINKNSGLFYLYNHYELFIDYDSTMDDEDEFRIVGFRIEPKSISHAVGEKSILCSPIEPQ